jgi:hypothetical protein
VLSIPNLDGSAFVMVGLGIPVQASLSGYRNADYIRAGGIMSLLFLALAVGAMWLLFV